MKLQQAFLPNCEYLRPDVVMLVSNDGWDIRALKEARSLAAQGLSVVMLGRRRFHTELARFTDEFDIDILNVPMVIDAETMRLHLEGGVWKRMSFVEKLLSSGLLALFSLTDLKIKPKKIPPPIHADVAEKLKERARMLARQTRGRRNKPVKSSGLSPWVFGSIQTFQRAYHRVRRGISHVLGTGRVGIAASRIFKYAALLLLSPAIIIMFATHWITKQLKTLFLRVLRRVARSHSKMASPFRFLVRKWHNLGRQAYRFSRFFLYTIEYGETVARLKPRAIHAHDLYTLQAATRIAKWTGAKVVYDAHELESDRRAGTDKRMSRWIINQEKKYAPQASRCVTVSHAIADEMEKTLNVKRPEIVFNAPITSKPPAGWEQRTLRGDLALPRKVPLFVFVGKIYDLYKSNQRVGLIIEALQRCPGYHLALVGPIGPEAVREIQEAKERLGLHDRLHLVAPIPAEAIVSYIADADVGIYFMWPDTRNIDLTIPNKLFEFSLSGLPLVVSDLTSTRWFCERANNAILVSEKEPDAVAAACREAYEKASSLKPGKKDLEGLRKEFSWETQGAKLVKLYDTLFDRAA